MRGIRQHFTNPLWFSAAGSGFIYLAVFTLPFLLPQYYATIPPLDYAKLTGYSAAGLWAYFLGISALFGLYLWALRHLLTTGYRPGFRFVWVSSAVFAAILIFSYPITAIDMFVYAIHGRSWALTGLSPLAVAPKQALPADPWLGLAGEWASATSPYGPLWEGLTLGVFYAGGGNFLAQLLLLKLLGALAYLGCIWLIYQTLRHLRPDWATAGALAFAWNPLALFECVQNGHNDIAMSFFLLAAIWVMSRPTRPTATPRLLAGPQVAACLLLAASILVKFITAAVVPFFLLALACRYSTWRQRAGAVVLCGGLVAGLVIMAMAPFWPGWQNWGLLTAGGQAGRSLLSLATLALRSQWGFYAPVTALRAAIFTALALIYLSRLWRTAHNRTGLPPVTRAIAASFAVLFWYMLLANSTFHAWYLLWFVPLAPLLLPQPRPLAAAIVFSVTALLVIPCLETVRIWYPQLLNAQLFRQTLEVPLLIMPPALTLLWPIRPAAGSEV